MLKRILEQRIEEITKWISQLKEQMSLMDADSRVHAFNRGTIQRLEFEMKFLQSLLTVEG